MLGADITALQRALAGGHLNKTGSSVFHISNIKAETTVHRRPQ
jgi:hypothetical protein